MSLYKGAVKRPIMTSLCFVAVMVFGLYSLQKLPIDLFPDIETNTIMVMTSYDGASASDIENNVTRPLENVLNTVSHLKHITSKSKENISVITLEFEYGYDIDVLTNDVRDKLDLVESALPDEVGNPIIFKFSADMIPIVVLSVKAGASLPALYKILDEGVANPLARVSGVGTVSIVGAPQREIHVYCDPNKLESYNLTIEAISAKIGAENRNVPGGNIDIGSDTYPLRVQGEFSDATQLNNIIVGNYGGRIIYLRDVARVEDSVQERAQEAYNDGAQGAMIVIQKQSGANSVEIADKVHNIMPELQKSLPRDVELGVIIDTSENIRYTIDSLGNTIRDALIFVALVVFVFLGRWRSCVIILITIPLSLVASFIYLAVTGSSLNIISLSSLSIAIGLVVDDAIVVLENITNHIERGSEPKEAAVHGTNEMAVSVVASTLTLFAVFFPLTLVTGMAGVLFRELGWMVCIIMLISLICAVTLTPMMCSVMLRLNPKRSKFFNLLYHPIEVFLAKFDTGYANLVNRFVRHRVKVILGSILFFFITVFISTRVGTEYVPISDDGFIGAVFELPIGTRTEISRKIALEVVEDWKKKYPEIECINFSVGQADTDDAWSSLQNNGSYIVSYNIRLSPMTKRERGIVEICNGMRQDLGNIPDLKKFKVNIGGGEGSSMSGESTLDLEVYGYDFAETDKVAKELQSRMSKIPGCADVSISRGDYQPEFHIVFDREKLALHGLSLSEAANYARNRINGSIASRYREEGEEYDIRVTYTPAARQSLESIENILLYNSKGQSVRLRDVGRVIEELMPPTIERKDRTRVNTVTAVISGTSMDKVVDAAKKVMKEVNVPSGVDVQFSGTYEDQQESFSDLMLLGILIVLLVFIVMAAEFESLTYPFIIMFSLPFSFSGVWLFLWLTGNTINLMSGIGMIMLIGIVVKNGIVLVDFINLCRERGQGIIPAVVTAARSRLRPVVMTTMTTILGMLPLAVSGGQGSEIWKPMGLTVIGGLAVSTTMTLLFIPVLYCSFAGVGVRRKRRKHRKQLANKE